MKDRIRAPLSVWRAIVHCLLGLAVCSLSGCFAGTVGVALLVVALANSNSGSPSTQDLVIRDVQTARLGTDIVLVEYTLEHDRAGEKQVAFWWAREGVGTWNQATPHLEPVAITCANVGTVGGTDTCGENDEEGNLVFESSGTVAERDGETIRIVPLTTKEGESFCFLWNAREDLNGAARASVRVTAHGDAPDRNVPPAFNAGNDPPEIVRIVPTGSEGFIRVAITIEDTTPDSLEVIEQTFSFEGVNDANPTPLELEGGAGELVSRRPRTADDPRNNDSNDMEGVNVLFWDSRDTNALGNVVAEGKLTLRVRDVSFVGDCRIELPSRVARETVDFVVDNNDDPTVVIDNPRAFPDKSFEIPIRFTVSDDNADDVNVFFQWALQNDPFPSVDDAAGTEIPTDTPTTDQLLFLQELIGDAEALEPDATLAAEREQRHVLSQAPTRLRGVVGDSAGLALDEVRIADLVRKGLVHVAPNQGGPRPVTTRNARKRFVVGREVRFLDPLGDPTASQTILAFDPATSVVRLSEALTEQVPAGTRYDIRIDRPPLDLESSSEGLVYSFIWDSRGDVPTSSLERPIRIRAVVFDSQQLTFSRDVEVDVTSNSVTVVQREAVESPLRLGIGDVTGDGVFDVCVPVRGRNGAGVQIFSGPEQAEVDVFEKLDELIARGTRPRSVTFANVDRNDLENGMDIIVMDEELGSTKVFRLDNGKAVVGGDRPDVVLATPFFRQRALVIHDVDADGDQDVVLLTRSSLRGDQVQMFLQGEDRTLGTQNEVILGPKGEVETIISLPSDGFGTQDSAVDVAAGDLDGNGRPDLAVAVERGHKIELYYSVTDHTGNREPEVVLEELVKNTGQTNTAIAIADVSRDGRDDLVVARSRGASGPGSVGVFLQGPQGELPRQPIELQAEIDPVAVDLVDFNGDGSLDILALHRGSRSIVVYEQGRERTRFTPERTVRMLTDPFPESFATVDFSGDGRLDFAITHSSNDAVFYRQDTSGSLIPSPAFESFEIESPRAVAIGDVNSDGRNDVVVTDIVDGVGTVLIFLQRRDGQLVDFRDVALEVHPDAPQSPDVPTERGLALEDFNGDGLNDIVVLSELGTFILYSQTFAGGNVTYRRSEILQIDAVKAFQIEDIDGDGTHDLVVAAAAVVGESALGTALHVYRNADLRSIGTGPAVTIEYTRANPTSVAVGDLDGDGRTDIAVGHVGDIEGGKVAIHLQKEPQEGGVVTFASRPIFGRSGLFTNGVAIGEFDGDGVFDLVSVAPGFPGVQLPTGVLYALTKEGEDLSFLRRVQLDVQSPDAIHRPMVDVALIDIERDGLGEVVVIRGGDAPDDLYTVDVFSGQTGERLRRLSLGAAPQAVAVGDINGDGRGDVAVVTKDSLEVFLAR